MALSEEERMARHREQDRKWREANRERARERSRERSRQWREANRERYREQRRNWREANPERYREQRRNWREANPERVREQARQWREANPERVQENIRQWREANAERARNLSRQSRHIRRARKANAIDVCAPQVTTAAIDRRFWLFGNACAYCGADSLLHLDHLDPLARGGLHVPQNLVPACERCNLSKGAKPVEAWYLSQPFFSPERWEALQLHTARRWTAAKQLSLLDHFS